MLLSPPKARISSVTDEWSPPMLTPHPEQSRLWTSKSRFCCVVAGRGSGKTEMARRRIVIYLALRKPWPDPIYVYALPTYSQAKKVAWKPLIRMIPSKWIEKNGINVTDMSISTVFGSTLYIVGMDRPERIEGLQIDGVVVDESSDQKPNSFYTTLMPTFTHRSAWAWRIGVPKRHGIGAADFRDYFERGKDTEEKDIDSFWWASKDIISEEEIDLAQRTLDPIDFREQFEASWEGATGAIFHAFDESLNVSDNIVYDPKKPIVVGSDFNVDPMCWVLMHRGRNELSVFDEIWLRNTNTQATLNHLYERYGEHKGGWEFFGDAAAKARHTSASKSDYLIIRNDERFLNKSVYYTKANPPVADRFASCNAMFCNSKGERRMKIAKKCTKLIRDLRFRSYKEGTNIPDDSGDIGHITDALGYPVYRLFPIRPIQTSKPKVIIA